MELKDLHQIVREAREEYDFTDYSVTVVDKTPVVIEGIRVNIPEAGYTFIKELDRIVIQEK